MPIESAIQQFLSPSEYERLQATSSSSKRSEFLLSRALMRHALSQCFSQPTSHWKFVEHPGQRPTINNLPENTHFSLSHSKGYICFALANTPVGIDLEKLNAKRCFLKLAKAVMDDEEMEFFVQNSENLANNFYRSWCVKEAYYKMLSKQQQSGLTLREVSVPELRKKTEKIALITQQNPQFMLAIVMSEKPEQVIHHHFPSYDQLMAEFAQSFD